MPLFRSARPPRNGYGPIGQIVALLLATGAILQTKRMQREHAAQEKDHADLLALAQHSFASPDRQAALSTFQTERARVEKRWREHHHPDANELHTTSWTDVFKGKPKETAAKTDRQKREEEQLVAFLQGLSKEQTPNKQ